MFTNFVCHLHSFIPSFFPLFIHFFLVTKNPIKNQALIFAIRWIFTKFARFAIFECTGLFRWSEGTWSRFISLHWSSYGSRNEWILLTTSGCLTNWNKKETQSIATEPNKRRYPIKSMIYKSNWSPLARVVIRFYWAP